VLARTQSVKSFVWVAESVSFSIVLISIP